MHAVKVFSLVLIVATAPGQAVLKGECVVTEQCSTSAVIRDVGYTQVDRSLAYLLVSHTFPCEGVVTAWTLHAAQPGSLSLCVLRPHMNDQLQLVGCNTVTAEQRGIQIYDVPEVERLRVQNSDIIGIKWDKPTDEQVISLSEASGDWYTEMVAVSGFGQAELKRRWKEYLHGTSTPQYWTIPVEANVRGVADALRGAADQGSQDNEVWGIWCDTWKSSGASFEDMLAVLQKYVDWDQDLLIHYLDVIRKFCIHRAKLL